MEFDEDVEKAIKEHVPLFYRKMARRGLEDHARQKGVDRVTMAIFEQAKAKYLGGQL